MPQNDRMGSTVGAGGLEQCRLFDNHTRRVVVQSEFAVDRQAVCRQRVGYGPQPLPPWLWPVKTGCLTPWGIADAGDSTVHTFERLFERGSRTAEVQPHVPAALEVGAVR